MKTSKQTLEHDLVLMQSNMLNYALTLTTNRDEAKDLTQETTLKALSNIDKYYDNVNFKGWVFTIMHNLFINNYRRVVRTQTVLENSDNLYQLNLPQESGFGSPEGSFTYHEIMNVLDTFNDDYKTPFSMHFAGFKYDEIAKSLNLPLGTVKSRIFFARKRLQEILKDYK
ncbi:MAG: RNA polymerase sigma factor [Dysgonomonas sp.]|jgi:RNA polymerase sigma-70 factor (ECF subfamily)|uniref:RNA polymerase sigma factor n=1 Tax=unclassified Dysgonomonas TaxID=2630389 RepID=UPI0025C34879|nr:MULTISPECIES: RNA polymerase sigma factor [unclassified Dysgonomonas]MDR1715264.1 RNA polymerase sigma factor [Prevotella sp.]MDR2001852.1 RNA polymerase sigma factor [Prevotella sp.]HMM04200.1 RNA polymerase sigma factor [Dysgonomonas sp.]